MCDPIDLIYQKENLREYASESKMLLKALPSLKSVDDVAAKLHAIFAHEFSVDIVRGMDFAPHAAIIYQRWQRTQASSAS